MLETDNLIIGAGLTGLAAGKVFEGRSPYFIAEKANGAGGLAASVKKDGFIFDYSGHLIHLHDPEISGQVFGLLGENIRKISRETKVFLHGTWTDFPFQTNLYPMPENVKKACLNAFLKARKENKSYPGPEGTENFENWALRTLGSGIYRYFMRPYNLKLWQYPLDQLTTEWCAPFVPQPKEDDVLKGLKRPNKKLGYNTVFYYPKTGGIASLANSLAKNLNSLRLGLEVEEINIKERTAEIRHFGPIHFKNLINTTPLNTFIGMIKDAPDTVKKQAGRLRNNTVYVLNLGLSKPLPEFHWAYFPESVFPFYRVGISSNFSARVAPRGKGSLYIEIATDGTAPDFDNAERAVIRQLVKTGIIISKEQIITKMWLKIPCAYVIFNKERTEALPLISEWLETENIYSVGRYGAWKYSFMEESLKEGRDTAYKILNGAGRKR